MTPFTLRSFIPSDSQSLAFHANSREVWLGVRDIFPFPYTEQHAQNFIAHAVSTQTEIIRAIDVNGKAVGAIGLHLKNDVQRLNGEIGYWIGVGLHGKGIATQAVAQMVGLAFAEYNLLRVYAEVFSNNPASTRVLEKNGFELEARLKKAVIKNHEVHDLLIYAKINTNWVGE
jgi:RimJ/RimL family protein N-acetyltransferase